MASKIQEEIFLEGFLDKCPGRFTLVSEWESPDFILRDSDGEIGFEVAQVFRTTSPSGSPYKAVESRRDKFLRKLAEVYYAKGGLPLRVRAILPDRPSFDMEVLAERLCKERPGRFWETSEFSLDYPVKFRLTALPMNCGRYGWWQCVNNSVGWVRTFDQPRNQIIKGRIAEKEGKIPIYRKTAKRVALLLVLDRTQMSGMVEWDDNKSLCIGKVDFDMVFLYIHPLRVVQLHPLI